jgi:hypothetical protein
VFGRKLLMLLAAEKATWHYRLSMTQDLIRAVRIELFS